MSRSRSVRPRPSRGLGYTRTGFRCRAGGAPAGRRRRRHIMSNLTPDSPAGTVVDTATVNGSQVFQITAPSTTGEFNFPSPGLTNLNVLEDIVLTTGANLSVITKQFSETDTPAPEPSSLVLLASGLIGLSWLGCRRKGG
jgi:PEP-CTERM motif